MTPPSNKSAGEDGGKCVKCGGEINLTIFPYGSDNLCSPCWKKELSI